jgi:ABC-type multidrug transport system fused ATPase/permease subunit
VTSEDIAGKDIIPPLSSAEGIAATVISSVTSQAKSAATAAATAIPGANAIEKLIPRNCSLGTKKFCVGFSNRIECHDLPLNVSNVLPEALTSFIGDQVQDLRSLEGILAKLTSGFVRDWLISGLVLGLVMIVLFAWSIIGPPYGLFLQPLSSRLALALALKVTVGLVCIVSFLVPTTVLNILCSKSQRLQSNVQAKKGDASGYSLVALFCVVVMMVLTVFAPDFVAKFSP